MQSEHIFHSKYDPEGVERRAKGFPVKNSKDIRRAVFQVKARMTQEFLAGIAKLKEANGTQISAPIDKAFLKECSREFQLHFYDIEKYGLKKKSEDSEYYLVESAKTREIFGKATLVDGTVLDPCFIYPSEFDRRQMFWYHRSFVAGGSVKKIEKSKYMLPLEVIEAARNTPEIRIFTFSPLPVTIRGELKYLVPDGCVFFRCGDLLGEEVRLANKELSDREMTKLTLGKSLDLYSTTILGDWPGANDLKHVGHIPAGYGGGLVKKRCPTSTECP